MPQVVELSPVHIAAWGSQTCKGSPPDEVHFYSTRVDSAFRDYYLVRFQSAEMLDLVIAQLQRYRQEVWPVAE